MNKTSTVNIKEALKETGWTQGALAKKMGVHRTSVNRWVKGKFPMEAGERALLAEVLRAHRATPKEIKSSNVISEPGDYGIVKIDGSYKLGRLEDFHGRLKIDTAGVTLVFLEEKEANK